MRLFTAIELPEEAREHLARLLRRLTAYVVRAAEWGHLKFVRPENLHATLKFLGEVAEERVEDVSAALASMPAVAVGPLSAANPELLPPRGPIRVVAVGLAGDVQGVRGLVREVEERCADLGVQPERRDFRAHVTLARARNPMPGSNRPDLADVLAADLPGPAFTPAHFTLFQSVLKPTGPEYTPLARFPLRS
jgi:2'-5' RNA ligase